MRLVPSMLPCVQCVLIAAITRMGTPALGLEMAQTLLAHPREEVVGIGMNDAEAGNPPEKFWKAYRLAGERIDNPRP